MVIRIRLVNNLCVYVTSLFFIQMNKILWIEFPSGDVPITGEKKMQYEKLFSCWGWNQFKYSIDVTRNQFAAETDLRRTVSIIKYSGTLSFDLTYIYVGSYLQKYDLLQPREVAYINQRALWNIFWNQCSD